MSNILTIRKKLALSIAEAIENKWSHIGLEGYDVDEAATLIELMLPMSVAEAQAVMDTSQSTGEIRYPLPGESNSATMLKDEAKRLVRDNER